MRLDWEMGLDWRQSEIEWNEKHILHRQCSLSAERFNTFKEELRNQPQTIHRFNLLPFLYTVH